jgi:hypothetical protein
MADKGVLVEVTSPAMPSSSASGKDHPFTTYRKFSVPVALSTDDEGVSRIDLTHEYQGGRNVRPRLSRPKGGAEQIEYSFLPGSSLWGEKRAGYGSVAEACGSDALGAETPSQACASFIAGSEKAKQQWELEARFTAFEATH